MDFNQTSDCCENWVAIITEIILIYVRENDAINDHDSNQSAVMHDVGKIVVMQEFTSAPCWWLF